MPRFVAVWATTVTGLCAMALLCDPAVPTQAARDLTLCFIPYGLLLWVRVDTLRHPLRFALGGAGIAGLCMVAAPSVLSDDLYRYLWDGRMWLAGVDAYALPPDDPSLWALRDENFEHINHRGIPTIYPPLAQALFAAGVSLWAHPAIFKLLALGCHLITTLLVHGLSRHGGDRSRPRAALLFALNPLCLSEAALGGHIDAAVGMCVIALALALLTGKTTRAVILTVASSGLKLVGLFIAPLLWRTGRGRAAVVVAMFLSALCVLPPWWAGSGSEATASGLSHYSQRWRGNEGPFRLLEAVVQPLTGLIASDPGPALGPEEVQLRWLQPVLSALEPTASRAVFSDERKLARPPSTFARTQVTFMLARALALLLVFAAALACVGKRVAGPQALRIVLWTLLLTAAQVHPWYLLWLLPLDIALGHRAAIVWSATALIAYAPLNDWVAHRIWHEAGWAALLQYIPVALSLCAEAFMPANVPPTCVPPLTTAARTD